MFSLKENSWQTYIVVLCAGFEISDVFFILVKNSNYWFDIAVKTFIFNVQLVEFGFIFSPLFNRRDFIILPGMRKKTRFKGQNKRDFFSVYLRISLSTWFSAWSTTSGFLTLTSFLLSILEFNTFSLFKLSKSLTNIFKTKTNKLKWKKSCLQNFAFSFKFSIVQERLFWKRFFFFEIR